ncbi:hypothetical protein A4J19_26705 [Salmonella enterica subsp. enterica serovar Oranienburg]|uniref:Uncharacterized protein n=1 Tax=Salmonella enterica I TaxID=59201 RepID=A0A403MPB7_SALET|nr:hypothetical protein [Salmonella enterica subsp. enterica serovar Oranienburg]MLU99996.1 hypothetical protein [Salmonella enterica subsp. enterica serovar Oranienburg]
MRHQKHLKQRLQKNQQLFLLVRLNYPVPHLTLHQPIHRQRLRQFLRQFLRLLLLLQLNLRDLLHIQKIFHYL